MGRLPTTPVLSFSPGHPLPRDTGRLPSYRESHMRRFHPYPRYELPAWQRYEHLMHTVDYRYEEEPSMDMSSLYVIDEMDEDLENLEAALSNGAPPGKRRRRLSLLVIELALAIKQAVTSRKATSKK
ncbi:hypothetical protein FOMPIDRAFT_1054788 [Fomitopsis schrenkii]|uniref:Uncharacterized protein n=1 Tax=Fomitopsis schrenkii TaxID=2126942 RepID=S8EZ39_FOMSC|nr:hypothetical protein FOMPIDRAFT_1054788 [Fomitopsis schrenkii]